MKKFMKKFIYTVMGIASLGVFMVTLNFYIGERQKIEALQSHMTVLASKGELTYITAEEQAKIDRAEKKRKKAEEKQRKKEAEAAEKARKLEEQRLKEEALKKKKAEELQQKKREEEQKKIAAKQKIMNVGLVSQLPEYKNGCEITALTMLLNYNGVNVDKHTLADKVKKDNTAIKYDSRGNIVEWGNPEIGFVGDITGKTKGYSIDPAPLMPLLNEYLPDRALNLTGVDFSEIERILLDGRTIIAWITSDFKPPSRPAQWTNNGQVIHGNFSQHAVLLTGIDENFLYYNDPLGNKKGAAVSKDTFKYIWDSMGNKALSYYK